MSYIPRVHIKSMFGKSACSMVTGVREGYNPGASHSFSSDIFNVSKFERTAHDMLISQHQLLEFQGLGDIQAIVLLYVSFHCILEDNLFFLTRVVATVQVFSYSQGVIE